MQVWNVLHAARWKYRTQKVAKKCHLGTIAQLCRAISLQLRHISTIRKKVVKQQCLPYMSSQYGELWHTSGWDLLASLRHPCRFQRVSRLGSITARHSSSGRQPNFAAFNRGRHRVGHWPTFVVFHHLWLALLRVHRCNPRYQPPQKPVMIYTITGSVDVRLRDLRSSTAVFSCVIQGRPCVVIIQSSTQIQLITFCVNRRRRKMYCGHARLCVCLSVRPRPYTHITARTRV